MKRIIILLSLLLSIFVSAQNIQDTFFGQKLGSKVSESDIKKGLEGKFSTDDLSVDKVYPVTAYSAGVVSFGGVVWENVTFCSFFEDQALGSVVFSRKTLEESSIEQDRKRLEEALTKKYGTPEKNEDGGLKWMGENGISVVLTITETTGFLGVTYNALNLAYYHLDVMQKYKDQINDEL